MIFVYGTLKRGQRRHELLLGQVFLREAVTLPRYRLYDNGRYPCLVEAPESGVAVTGEIWQVEEDVLKRLDDYEGVPDLYVRRRILLQEQASPVWSYFFCGDVTDLKDCGSAWPM